MARANSSGKTGNDTKVTSKTTGGMAMANSNGQTVECTTEDGSKASNMEKVLLSTKRVRKSVGSGEMARGSNGSITNMHYLHYFNTSF